MWWRKSQNRPGNGLLARLVEICVDGALARTKAGLSVRTTAPHHEIVIPAGAAACAI
jgi:hypothetical protein